MNAHDALNIKNEKNNLLSQTGQEYAYLFKSDIVSKRINNFSYDNWPFKYQDQEELEECLYNYGVVTYFYLDQDNKKGLVFVPVTLSGKRGKINKLNAKTITVTIAGNYNQYIMDAFNLNSEEHKATMPFIFDNPKQNKPSKVQRVLFDMLADTVNANESNRINKNKQAILEVENGQAIQAAILADHQSKNYRPFIIVEKNPNNKDNPITSDSLKPMTNTAQDLYNSLSTERKDVEKYIEIVNGIRGSQNQEKSSAQETDNQSNSQDRNIANTLSVLIRQRKKDFKNLRSNHPSVKAQVELRETIKNFVDSVDIGEAIKAVGSVENTEASAEAEQNDSLLDRIKKWFTGNNPDKEKTPTEE